MHDESTIPLRLWHLAIIVFSTVVAIVLPLYRVLDWTASNALIALNLTVTAIFFTDMVLHFFRPVIIKGQRITDRRLLARHYLNGWFLIDLLAAVPFGTLTGLPFLHLLRLLKLCRVAQMIRSRLRREIQRITLFRLSTFVFWLGLTTHWLSCGWLVIREPVADLDKLDTYIRALYWCVTTLTTVGYGDVTPETTGQIIYTMIVMVLGVAVYGFVIGNVANLLSNIDLSKAHYMANMERLTTFLKYRNIPNELRKRIYDYYNYLWEHKMGYDESAVLSEIPPSLRAEVSLVIKRDFIEKVPFLRGSSHEFIRDIACELKPAVFTPATYVFRAGEMGRHMYFISHGKVEVIAGDGKTLFATLKSGDFFGEIALLSSQPRTATVRTIDYCDMYTLNKETFDRVLRHYPDFEKHMQHMAQQRQGNDTNDDGES